MVPGNLKEVFRLISKHDARNRTAYEFFDNTLQKWSFITMFTFYGLATFVTLVSLFGFEDLKLLYILFILICVLAATTYIVSIPIGMFRFTKQAASQMFERVGDTSADNFELSKSLASVEESLLSAALNYLKMESEHLRSRVSLMVGAIEKLGLIPIVLTTIYTVTQFSTGDDQTYSWLDGALIALVGLYIMSVFFVLLAQRMERYCLVLETAMSLNSMQGLD